jgi:hypothetical protein
MLAGTTNTVAIPIASPKIGSVMTSLQFMFTATRAACPLGPTGRQVANQSLCRYRCAMGAGAPLRVRILALHACSSLAAVGVLDLPRDCVQRVCVEAAKRAIERSSRGRCRCARRVRRSRGLPQGVRTHDRADPSRVTLSLRREVRTRVVQPQVGQDEVGGTVSTEVLVKIVIDRPRGEVASFAGDPSNAPQ